MRVEREALPTGLRAVLLRILALAPADDSCECACEEAGGALALAREICEASDIDCR